MAVRTGKRVRYKAVESTRDISEPAYTWERWEELEADYRKACRMSVTPGESFMWANTGDILDEDKTVRWNREEVARLQNVYKEEKNRLKELRNKAIRGVEQRAIRQLAEDAEISEEKAQILWNFIYNKYHADGVMFQYCEEYAELIRKILEPEK